MFALGVIVVVVVVIVVIVVVVLVVVVAVSYVRRMRNGRHVDVVGACNERRAWLTSDGEVVLVR